MADRLRVIIAGTGYFSGFHFDAWSRCPEVEVVGVAGLDSEALARAATDYDIPNAFENTEEMLSQVQPDILDIITPPATHLKLIEAAASRNINVICQKPFCGSLEAAKTAVRIASDADIQLIVHENFRFQPWYTAIKRELDAGRLGQIYRAHFRLRPGDGQGVEAYLERQPYFKKMEKFLVHETAIHLVDVARFFFGDPNTISADLARLNPVIAGEDSAIIVMGFEDGVRTVIDGNRLSDHKAENRRRTMGEVLIEGEKGCLSLSGDGVISFRRHGENEEAQISYDWNDRGFGGDCVYLFTRHVVDHFVHDAPISNSGQDYLANLEIEEAIYASAEDGQRKSL